MEGTERKVYVAATEEQWKESLRAWKVCLVDFEVSGKSLLMCTVPLKHGLSLVAYDVNGRVFVAAVGAEYCYHNWTGKREEVSPFIQVEVLGEAEHRRAVREVPKHYNRWEELERERKMKTAPLLESYGDPWYPRGDSDPSNRHVFPWIYIPLRISLEDGVSVETTLSFKWPTCGRVLFPKDSVWPFNLETELDCYGLLLRRTRKVQSWKQFKSVLQECEVDNETLWTWYLGQQPTSGKTLAEVDQKGTKALERDKTIKPHLDRLAKEEPLLFDFYLWLHDSKTLAGAINNRCIAAMLREHGSSYEKLRSALRETMGKVEESGEVPNAWSTPSLDSRPMCLLLPGAVEAVQKQEAQRKWYLQASNQKQAEALGVDPKRHSRLHKAIREGHIPMTLFHEPGAQMTLVNVEFDLWENCLQRPGWESILLSIAADASKRTTYSHLVTSYLSFLFQIEKYLDRHTEGRKKWKAYPKFVESQWELEMEEATEEGTTKRRSALTPIVDNEARTVQIPYVSMAVYGRRTTYCYAARYVLFEEGHNDSYGNGVVIRDLEEKLNGRDDYGLMYYTFTGTDINRGYPTFLIIFERTTQHGTRVHFHRVHPNRFKDGVPTPTCHLIPECYRYMAGNIRAEEIYAQQGDLLFISREEPKGPEDAKGVLEFESHAFVPKIGTQVVLVENQAKSIKNRLGHIFSPEDFTLEHPEHETVSLPAGWYEVRRCRSWEANPTAVWSLMID